MSELFLDPYEGDDAEAEWVPPTHVVGHPDYVQIIPVDMPIVDILTPDGTSIYINGKPASKDDIARAGDYLTVEVDRIVPSTE